MKRTFLIASALAIMLSSCNQNRVEVKTESDCFAKLKVNVCANQQTKAIIEGSSLTDGSEVGFSLLEAGGADYDGFATYKNVKFTASSTGGVQEWVPDADILLSTTSGTLYAYYPYSSAVTDITAVPVETDSQTDYMYGTPVPDLNNKNTSADMALNHALAAIRLSIVKGSFSGTGEITKISVNGEAIANAAKMNSLTGELSGFSGMDTRISPAITAFTVGTTPTEKDFIIIPTGESKPLTITIEIDGLKIEAETAATDFAEGTITCYNVTVNSKNLQLTSVAINPWGSQNNGNIDIF